MSRRLLGGIVTVFGIGLALYEASVPWLNGWIATFAFAAAAVISLAGLAISFIGES